MPAHRPGKHQARNPWTPDAIERVLVNPFHAVTLDPGLCVPHEAIVGRDDWVKAGARLIAERGAEAYLRLLLDVLEGNYVTASES